MKNIIHKIVTEMMKSVFMCLPAEVIKYDPEKINATVKPLQDNLPENYEVPVLFSAASNCRMTWPIKEGDKGLLIFSSRDIDPVTDGTDDPEYTMENYNDALFIPTIPFNDNQAAEPDKISIEFGGTSLKMSPSGIDIIGDVNVQGSITSTGDQVAGVISTISHVHGGVDSGPSNTSPPV